MSDKTQPTSRTEITVFGTNIRKDAEGRFSLNDLHKAAMTKGHATESQRPGNFIKSSKDFLDVVNDNATVVAIKKQAGKGGGTYATELVALRYAGWISSSVEVEVYQTFQKVIHADEDLTADMIDRQTDPEAMKRLAARAQGKATRLHFTDVLKDHGVTGTGYALCTDAIYKPLLGGTAKQIKNERGLPEKANLRESMSRLELVASMFAEEVAINRIEITEAQGNRECQRHSKEAGEETKAVINRVKR